MRGEERRQRPMLMVLNVEQRIARDHPLQRIKQMAARVLNISADDADMFAVATLSSRWLREHWPEIIRDRAISVPFSSWDDGDAFAQYDLGVQPSPSVVQGAVLLSDGVDPPQGTQLRVVLTTVNDSSPDQSTFTAPDGSLHRACGWRHASGSKEPIDTCFVDVQPELGTRRAGILETTVLSDRSVLCIGLGTGVAHAAIELAKCGVGRFMLVDQDRLTVGNVVRHPGGISQVGRFKVNVVRHLIHEKNPDAQVSTYPVELTYDNRETIKDRCAS